MCLERHNRRVLSREKRPPQHSKMVTKTGKLIISLIFFGALYTADAAITAWTKPTLNTADGVGTLSVEENQGTDETIATVIATGAGDVTYALTPAVSPFAVSTAGVLTITAALDYETTETYTLSIVATDADGGATGTLTLTVTVTAVNEHAPMFSATSYSRCIVDASPADTTLTTVTATDQDTSQTLTYAMISGNTNTDFTIDTSTGLIQVNTAKTLNKTATATYDLVVTAADSIATFRTATTTVSVTVADSCSSGTIVAVSTMMLIVSLFVALF